MNRPALESLLIRVNEIGHDRSQDGAGLGGISLPSTGAPGNKGDVYKYFQFVSLFFYNFVLYMFN